MLVQGRCGQTETPYRFRLTPPQARKINNSGDQELEVSENSIIGQRLAKNANDLMIIDAIEIGF
jgi:hypothetical protein